MKTMPTVWKYMSLMPHTIGSDIPVKKAGELMQSYQVRHLPVQEGGKLVGIISDRDVRLVHSVSDAATTKVEEIMTPDPYVVFPETPLDEVVLTMAKHKFGSALIRQADGKVVGILTATDGMRVLGEFLRERYGSPAAEYGTK